MRKNTEAENAEAAMKRLIEQREAQAAAAAKAETEATEAPTPTQDELDCAKLRLPEGAAEKLGSYMTREQKAE